MTKINKFAEFGSPNLRTTSQDIVHAPIFITRPQRIIPTLDGEMMITLHLNSIKVNQGQQNFQQQYRAPFQQNNQSYNKPQYNAPPQNNASFPQNTTQANQSNKAPMSAEDLVNSLAHSLQGVNMKVDTMQGNMQSSITNLEKTVGRISSALNRIEAKGNAKLTSQSLPPPNVSGITLRSGKKIEGL